MKQILALSLLAAMATSPVLASDEKADVTEAPADLAAIADLDLANRLLDYSERAKDPQAALVAARILATAPGGTAGPMPKAGEQKIFQTSAADVKKLDADAAKAAAAPRVELALELANKLGKADPTVKASAEKIGKLSVQYYPATCWAYNTLGATFYWMGPNVVAAQSSVMAYCRANTPYGHFCYISHCN